MAEEDEEIAADGSVVVKCCDHKKNCPPGRALMGEMSATNRHTKIKTAAKVANTVVGKGLSAANHANRISAAAGAGVAVSSSVLAVTGPAGLVVMAGEMALSARSAYKTHQHIKGLEGIFDGRKAYEQKCIQNATEKCTCGIGLGSAAVHKACELTLLYIINKKQNKRIKKGLGAVALSPLTTGYGAGKAAYKLCKGTKGKNRGIHASILAQHLIESRCEMAQAIVADLFDDDTMMFLMYDAGFFKAAETIAEKMKST